MFTRINARNLSDLLLPLSRRADANGVYFVRLCQWSPEVKKTVWDYHEAARERGVIIDGQINNPDDQQLRFMAETLGTTFEPTPPFITNALQKWMPRMSSAKQKEFATALCTQFDELRKSGKTDSILRNIYYKVMCWLYYKFERLMPFLGNDDSPKVLYVCNAITAHELILLRILSMMGADILLLEPTNDSGYLKHDSKSVWSQLITVQGAAFPPNFTLKDFRKEMARAAVQAPGASKLVNAPIKSNPGFSPRPVQTSNGNSVPHNAAVSTPPRSSQPVRTGQASAPHMPPQPQKRNPESYFPKPSRSACTNAWMKEASIDEILTPIASRGDDFQLFYNAFIRLKGVPDRLTYMNELFQFYQKFKNTGRNLVIVDDELSLPGPEETARIRRHPYHSTEELIIDIAGNLPACANVDLQRLMQQSFVRTMMMAAKAEPNLNRLVISAVYLLCWIQQYQSALFQGYRGNEIPCFVLMGGCRNQHDALYIQFLAQLPVDVLILACDLNRICSVTNDKLLELSGADSLPVPRFPKDAGTLQMRTMASNAEQDLTTILYTDSGIYRNRQFSQADAITLRTTYDEIFILWNQELKYRSNFSTVNQAVNMPVIYAKVSGIENGKVEAYWQKIKLLLSDQTMLIKSFPYVGSGSYNQYQALAVKALRNGKLKRDELKAHRQYPFALLREELQEHIFDKIQIMLDRKLIKGTYSNGTEYTIIATILNLNKDLVRMLQSFDFTKKNPKVVAICTGEQVCSIEDVILLTFLNLVGFDVVLFVPTGYQTVERFLNDNYPVEHQIGEYVYDLSVPNFDSLPPVRSRSWLENILKRGN